MKGRMVAVLGISGVGKTTMVAAFTGKHPWAHSVRASALLKKAASQADSEALRTASVTDVHANQDRLTSAFSELRRRHPDRHIIFDGHSVIDNDETLVIVPTATFVNLAPDHIIFVEDKADAILARRRSDVSRIRPYRSVEEIAVHQQTAKEAALTYSAALSIQFDSIESGDAENFEMTLKHAFIAPH